MTPKRRQGIIERFTPWARRNQVNANALKEWSEADEAAQDELLPDEFVDKVIARCAGCKTVHIVVLATDWRCSVCGHWEFIVPGESGG